MSEELLHVGCVNALKEQREYIAQLERLVELERTGTNRALKGLYEERQEWRRQQQALNNKIETLETEVFRLSRDGGRKEADEKKLEALTGEYEKTTATLKELQPWLKIIRSVFLKTLQP